MLAAATYLYGHKTGTVSADDGGAGKAISIHEVSAANALTCWKLLFHFIFRRILAIHIGRHNLCHKRPDVRDFIF